MGFVILVGKTWCVQIGGLRIELVPQRELFVKDPMKGGVPSDACKVSDKIQQAR